MRVLQIGCGGIGSYLIEEIVDCIEQEQITAFTEICVADGDIVEVGQIQYQNFKLDEVGENKASAVSDRFREIVLPIPKRIAQEKQLNSFDLIILCVDNEKTREMVIRYCHKNDREFIDLRATGRRVFAMPKENSLDLNLKFVDGKDATEYSCQEKVDMENGVVQKGNKIVAMLGIQMLLNFVRGNNNRTISVVI